MIYRARRDQNSNIHGNELPRISINNTLIHHHPQKFKLFNQTSHKPIRIRLGKVILKLFRKPRQRPAPGMEDCCPLYCFIHLSCLIMLDYTKCRLVCRNSMDMNVVYSSLFIITSTASMRSVVGSLTDVVVSCHSPE